jgi:hypothetical protein
MGRIGMGFPAGSVGDAAAMKGPWVNGACEICPCLPWKGPRLKPINRRTLQGARLVEWYETLFEVIDMRSFSNLWYWIGLAVLWSSVSHWILGVPYDMVVRARRGGGGLSDDMETLAHINVKRLLYIARTAGMILVAVIAFVLTVLGLLAFVYQIEFAQAVLFLAFPMTIVGGISLRTAFIIEAENSRGDVLIRRIMRCRMAVQGVGMVALLVTSLFGMYQNLSLGALGG